MDTPKTRIPLGAFGFKKTAEEIKTELIRRSTSSKNAEVYMPSLRLLTTVDVSKLDRGFDECIYFCVGTHGYPRNPNSNDSGVSNEILTDIFDINTPNYPIVGYTIQGNGPNSKAKLIRAVDESVRNSSFPPPGITAVSISRNNNGRITRLHGTITVPSFAQFEILNKYFLIPGIGVMLEVANIYTNNTDQQEASPTFFDLGNSGRPDNLANVINSSSDAIVPFLKLEVITNKSIEHNGAYTAFFGRMANFKTTIHNNEYEINFECTGVGDASMGISLYDTYTDAHSAAITTRTNSADIIDWFVPKTEGIASPFLQLLITIINAPKSEYSSHVRYFYPGKLKQISAKDASKKFENDPSAVKKLVGDYENPIFISWPFFINIILNSKVGIRSIFSNESDKSNPSIKIIHPLQDYVFNNSEGSYDNEYEPLIGSHTRLRSIDAGTMIIYNSSAQSCAIGDKTYANLMGIEAEKYKFPEEYKILSSFHRYQTHNAGTLSHGVWLNTGMIIEAFKSSVTVHEAISYLLTKMNSATDNYWNLALDFDDHTIQDFIIIDLNFNDRVSAELQAAFNVSHIFNKPFTPDYQDGSDVLKLEFELALSSALMAQAVFSTSSGKVSYSGKQLDAFTKKLDTVESKYALGIEEYDITRKREEITDLSEIGITTLDGGILTLNRFSLAIIERVFGKTDAGQPLSKIASKIDEYDAVNSAVLGKDPSTILYEEIQNNADVLMYFDAATDRDRHAGADLQDTSAVEVFDKIQKLKEKEKGTLTEEERTLVKEYDYLSSRLGALTKTESLEANQTKQVFSRAKEFADRNLSVLEKDVLSDQLKNMKHLEAIFVMIELSSSYMKSKMAGSSDSDLNNNMGTNGMLPFKIELTIPGIGGLRSGEIVRIARLPEPFKNAGFLILGTTDTVDDNGWVTSIDAKLLPSGMFIPKEISKDASDSCGGDITDIIPPTFSPPTKKNAAPEEPPSIFDAPSSSKGVCPQLKKLIESKEGNYNSINRGRAGDTVIGKQEYWDSIGGVGKYLVELRIEEILTKFEARKINGVPPKSGTTIPYTILAAGKYQFIGDTLRSVTDRLMLSHKTVFDKITQDKLADALLSSKRELNKVLKCDPNANVDAAMLELAKEFASFPVPFDLEKSSNEFIKKGQSYYDGTAGNKAAHSVEQVRSVLDQCRSGCGA